MRLSERIGRFLQPLWPRTLFAQLLLIMVCGTLVVQFMSSSIWFDVRFTQVMESPARLIASRSAALIQSGQCRPDTLPASRHYLARCLDTPPERLPANKRLDHRIELLLNQALAHELGSSPPARLIDFNLRDDNGQPIVWGSLFGLRTAQAHVHFSVQLADGHWLEIEGMEQQGWSGEPAWLLISDYLLRVYVIRILAVLGICLLAVRLCLNPLKRLSEAALGLGHNLDQPPLPLTGPQEVRQAAQAFNTMQQRLIDMLNDQSHFMAAVSHDLRTPLTRMRLRIEQLKDTHQQERLRQNIAEMEGMISQVLDYLSCAEAPGTEPVDIDRLLAQTCHELANEHEPLPITGRAGRVEGNALMLQRCLQNLLQNALRYAHGVHLGLEPDAHGVTIHVEDRGPGIDEQLLDSITAPFVRGEASRNLKSGGYGLGLSIVKRIAQNHGGSLVLCNRKEGGLRASLWLPRHPGQAEPAPAAST